MVLVAKVTDLKMLLAVFLVFEKKNTLKFSQAT